MRRDYRVVRGSIEWAVVISKEILEGSGSVVVLVVLNYGTIMNIYRKVKQIADLQPVRASITALMPIIKNSSALFRDRSVFSNFRGSRGIK